MPQSSAGSVKVTQLSAIPQRPPIASNDAPVNSGGGLVAKLRNQVVTKPPLPGYTPTVLSQQKEKTKRVNLEMLEK